MQPAMGSLRGIDIFQNLSEADLAALSERCRWRRYAANEQIIHHQDESRDVYFIVEGEVRAITYSLDGKEVTYRDIFAGDMFGEFAAIDGEPRCANIVAVRKSFVAAMSDSCFWEVLQHYPSANIYTMKRLTSQLRILTERVFEFSTLAVKNRIHSELLRLARDHMHDEATAVIAPAPKHLEIASRIATHREAVTRELNELTRNGLVQRGQGCLVIRDVPRLARLVEEVLGEQVGLTAP
jgi:CRP-like cAMP-binding protein